MYVFPYFLCRNSSKALPLYSRGFVKGNIDKVIAGYCIDFSWASCPWTRRVFDSVTLLFQSVFDSVNLNLVLVCNLLVG